MNPQLVHWHEVAYDGPAISVKDREEDLAGEKEAEKQRGKKPRLSSLERGGRAEKGKRTGCDFPSNLLVQCVR